RRETRLAGFRRERKRKRRRPAFGAAFALRALRAAAGYRYARDSLRRGGKHGAPLDCFRRNSRFCPIVAARCGRPAYGRVIGGEVRIRGGKQSEERRVGEDGGERRAGWRR